MDRNVLSDGTIVWTGTEGASFLALRTATLVEGRVVGHGSVELGRTIQRELCSMIKSGPITLFTDWSELTDYDSRARTELTTWTIRHRDAFLAMHVLVRSRLVAMGLSVANLAIGGGIHSTADAATYRRDLRQSIRPVATVVA